MKVSWSPPRACGLSVNHWWAPRIQYGKDFKNGAGSLNFCGFEWLWFVFLWFPPRFPAPLHLLYRVYVSLGVCSVGKPRCIAEYCRPRSHAVEHLCLCFAQVVGTTHLAPPSLAGFQQPSGSALVSFPRFLGGVPDSVRGSEPGRGGLGVLDRDNRHSYLHCWGSALAVCFDSDLHRLHGSE